MLQNAIYSVASVEDAATVLHRDPSQAREIAESLKLTAQECLELGIVDLIVPEPSEGAHRNPDEAVRRLKRVLEAELASLNARSTRRILKDRYRKFRKMGEYNSHFRAAVTREVTHLQGYVTHGVQRIRRRRRRGDSTPPDEGK
jgi:acetyl-CoA carboxylase alpha subunit